MTECYLVVVSENNEVMRPIVYSDNDSMTEDLYSLIDTYKLDKADEFRHVNLEQGMEVTAWKIRIPEPSPLSS